MSISRRLSEPVRAPVRQVVSQYHTFFEDLIHAVKNELVARFDRVESRVEELDVTVSTSHESIADQLAMHAASVRTVSAEVERLHRLNGELQALTSAALEELASARDELREARKELAEHIAGIAARLDPEPLSGAGLSRIDRTASRLLNHAASGEGPLAEAGLYIDHPYSVQWSEQRVEIASVNRRIIEQPFVFAAVADLPIGSAILDIGGGQSTAALALASLGHRVTLVEPGGYPFEHPNLEVHPGSLQSLRPDSPYDATIMLAPHGSGPVVDGRGHPLELDADAMQLLAELTAPDGRLVLTATCSRDRMLDLLGEWVPAYTAVGRQLDDLTWQVESTELGDAIGPDRLAMVVATRPRGS